MDQLERELKIQFLEEASQMLDDVEQYFLALESRPDDPQIIENIFRLAHSFKGTAAAVGYSEISEFTHQLESLLVKIRKSDVAVNGAVVDLLLRCNDHMKASVKLLKKDPDASLATLPHHSGLLTELSEENGIRKVAGKSVVPEPSANAPSPALSPAQAPSVASAPSIAQAPVPTEDPSFSSPPATHATHATPATYATSASATSGDETIRVNLERLERLSNNVGELVIVQAVLHQHRHLVQSALLQQSVMQLSKITKEIQGLAMGLRMVPVKPTFQKIRRLVRDTTKLLNKQVRFDVIGEETEIDRTVLEHLGDPLVHLIRNSIDHGLEENEQERERLGKPPVGLVRLLAFHQGGHLVIEVRDDGRGLDPSAIRERAIAKGLLDPESRISDAEAQQLIFKSGFSTKKGVTEISGRGVGLDVVKASIERLQGEIQIDSEPGKGSCFRILVPLTLAIMDGMVVLAGSERYVVPTVQVHETIQPEPSEVECVTGIGEVIHVRGEATPLFRLSSILERDAAGAKPAWEAIAIIVRSNDQMPFAILVDDIIGKHQVVLKKLDGALKKIRGVTGSAILGDGRPALILDVEALVARSAARAGGPVFSAGAASSSLPVHQNLPNARKVLDDEKTEKIA